MFSGIVSEFWYTVVVKFSMEEDDRLPRVETHKLLDQCTFLTVKNCRRSGHHRYVCFRREPTMVVV